MSIPVAFAPRSIAGPMWHGQVLPGTSIAELVACVPDLPAIFLDRGEVRVDNVPVPRELWHQARLRERPDRPYGVTLHLAPAGQTGRLIASIAVLVGAALISGGALAPLGTALGLGGALGTGTLFPVGGAAISGAQIAGAAFAIGGSLAIAALVPPPSALGAVSRADQGVSGSSLAGSVLTPGASLPAVAGTLRIPIPILPPLIELVGEDLYGETIGFLAGPTKIEDVRFGTAPAADLPDVTVEIREGWATDDPVSLVTRQWVTDQPTQEMTQHKVKESNGQHLSDQSTPANSLPQWARFVTRDSPDEFWLSLAFPEGHFDVTNPNASQETPIRVRGRRKGDVTWINFPEVHLAGARSSVLRRDIRIKWGTAPTPASVAVPPALDGWILAHKNVPGQAVSPSTSGWAANSHFSAGSGNDTYLWSTYNTTNVRNCLIYTDRVEFWLDPATHTQGVWEFEVMVGHMFAASAFTASNYQLSGVVRDFFTYYTSSGTHIVDVNLNNRRRKVTITTAASIWNEDPAPTTDVAKVAVRWKNRQLEELNALCSTYVPDWNGSTAWDDWKVTSNPAPHLRAVRAGILNADPVSAALMDDTDYLAFRTHCSTYNYQVNALLEGSADDVAQMIAACGYGRERRSEKWGVFREYDRSGESPVQIFNPRNCRNVRWTKAFLRRPDGFRVRFLDKDLDYREREMIVLDPDASGTDRLEDLPLSGVVTEAEAEAWALFAFEVAKKRMRFYTCEADWEAVACRRGDLVGLQHEKIIRQAGYALVKEKIVESGNLTGLVVDGTIRVDAGVDWGVAIRCDDGIGTVLTKQVTGDDPETTEITFSTPFTDYFGVKEGALVSAGPLGLEQKRLILHSAVPTTEFVWALTFVDEASDLPFPDFS